MSRSGPVRKSSAIGLATGLALSALFGTQATAGYLYDQCLVFVVDSSTSAQPKGWQGQMRGIAAGLTDAEVVSKVSHMNAGIRAGLIVFSTQVKEMEGAHLRDGATLDGYARYIRDMQPPFGGANNLYGALVAAEQFFARIKAEGEDCIIKTIDFSGDGADSSVPHTVMREKVLELAAQGVTIHGLSFFDLRFGKYRARNSYAWIQGDSGMFDTIHDYYRAAIVTPVRAGARPGMHYTIDNQQDINTEGSIVTQLTELMRMKVRDEVASLDDIRRARYAHGLRPASVMYAGLTPH